MYNDRLVVLAFAPTHAGGKGNRREDRRVAAQFADNSIFGLEACEVPACTTESNNQHAQFGFNPQ